MCFRYIKHKKDKTQKLKMLTLQKNKLSSTQKLCIVFIASFMPLFVALICQLDVMSTLKATFLVFLSSVFYLYHEKRRNAFRLD